MAKPRYRSATGWYNSIKMHVSMPFESLLERDLFLVLDIDPEFVSFAAQPETFKWEDERGTRHYTPDAIVALRSELILYIQAKLHIKLAKDPSLHGRLPEIDAQCKLRGASHAIWTEGEIRREPRLSNARRLRAAVAFLNDESLDLILGACAKLGLPAPLKDIMHVLGNEKLLFNSVLGLTALSELSLDLSKPIDGNSLIRRGSCR